MTDEVADKFRKLASDYFSSDPAVFADSARFIEDLGYDSLDLVELIIAAEDSFDIDITDDEAAGISTVRDAIDLIARKSTP